MLWWNRLVYVLIFSISDTVQLRYSRARIFSYASIKSCKEYREVVITEGNRRGEMDKICISGLIFKLF